MPYRKETANKWLWEQMGLELEAVRLLLIGILCDEKYHLIMPKATMQKIDAAIRNLGKFRESAELRMNRVGVEGDFIYMDADNSLRDYVENKVDDFREELKRKAAPKLNIMSAADLQRMSDEELAALSMKEGD